MAGPVASRTARKPIVIAETGCAEDDWRITTSQAARRAFADGVGARHYG